MNRKQLFDFIEERLNILGYRVEARGKLNILDLHLHSENFYRDFLNLLYGWHLENLNMVSQNVEAIDLIDKTGRIVVQVSSTNTVQKIEGALSKVSMAKYAGWRFKFVSVSKDAGNLRGKSYENRHSLQFNPATDILDIDILLREVLNLDTERLRKVADFMKSEFCGEQSAAAIESDLAKVVTMLTSFNPDDFEKPKVGKEFQIVDKMDFNMLAASVDIINEYRIWQTAVSRVYEAFDSEGMNKSYFVRQKIRSFYINRKKQLSGDDLFAAVRADVRKEILLNAAAEGISREAVDVCSDILVVDSFIRCNIFENPEGNNDDIA